MSDVAPLSDLEEFDSEESDDDYTALPFPDSYDPQADENCANLGKKHFLQYYCLFHLRFATTSTWYADISTTMTYHFFIN